MGKLGKCPKCGSPDGLFICSLMAVNCSDCMQYIRPATREEREEIKKTLRPFYGKPKAEGVEP